MEFISARGIDQRRTAINCKVPVTMKAVRLEWAGKFKKEEAEELEGKEVVVEVEVVMTKAGNQGRGSFSAGFLHHLYTFAGDSARDR